MQQRCSSVIFYFSLIPMKGYCDYFTFCKNRKRNVFFCKKNCENGNIWTIFCEFHQNWQFCAFYFLPLFDFGFCCVIGVSVMVVCCCLFVRGLQFYTFLEFRKDQMAIYRYDKKLSFYIHNIFENIQFFGAFANGRNSCWFPICWNAPMKVIDKKPQKKLSDRKS